MMIDSRYSRLSKAIVAGAMLAFAHTGLSADEETDSSENNDEDVEEIIVRASRPGDQIDIEARYASLWRSRVIKDLKRMRVLEEEYRWRKSEAEAKSPSRIKWGYDPRAELRMRRSTDLTDLPFERTRPATLFRFEF